MTHDTNIPFNVLKPEPLLIVISGPSGVGKDSVVFEMKDRGLPFHFVVTATTRPPREGEVHGVDYYFFPKEEFADMIGVRAKDLIEGLKNRGYTTTINTILPPTKIVHQD